MKLIKIISILTCCALVLCACSGENTEEKRDIEDSWGLEMTIKDVTSTGAVVVFTQSGGDESLSTGEDYWLEYESDGNWNKQETKIEPLFTDLRLEIACDDVTELDEDWKTLYGELQSGKYRFCREVNNDDEERVFYAEFEIK